MGGSGTPALANCMKKGAALAREGLGSMIHLSVRFSSARCACFKRVLQTVLCSARLALLWMDTQAFNWNSLELWRLGC